MQEMKKFIMTALSAIICMIWSGCSDTQLDPSAEMSANAAETEPAQKVGRSVLVYLLADNNLGGASKYDRNNTADMIEAAKRGDLQGNRLIIYHDDANASCPMLKEVTPRGLRIIKQYSNDIPSSDPSRLRNVVDDFKAYAPASKYGMIFWSHAMGWEFAKDPVPQGGASPLWLGDDRGRKMEVTDFASALHPAEFDYIYFDCCLMSSVESLYEMRHVADYFAGSCTELLAEGMPYGKTLPMLMADDADIVGAAAATFDYYDAMPGSSRSCTMSVIKSSELDQLAEASRELYELHPQLPENAYIQRFSNHTTYLYDFGDYISKLLPTGDAVRLDAARAKWNAAIDKCVIYKAATPRVLGSIYIYYHCGLSTFPLRTASDATNAGYYTLQWYADVASALYAD